MAIYQKAIQGDVLKPDGTGYGGGTLEIKLSTPGTTEDDTDSSKHSVGGKTIEAISSAGAVSFNLVPNDEIVPAGTVYEVTYKLPGGYSFTERWSLSGVTAIYIGDITRITVPNLELGDQYLILADEDDLPAASASYRRVRAYVAAISGEADSEFICMKDDLDEYDWERVA